MAKETCPECGKELGSKSALSSHINKEHGKSPLTKLMADHGVFAPRPGGAWRPNRPLRAAPSGVPSIDYAIGIGGVPRGCIVEIFGPPSSGKALALDTPIPTPTGWITMGALEAGDVVCDDHGQPCRVKWAHEVLRGRDCYRVHFSDATSVVADVDHLWTTQAYGQASKTVTTGAIRSELDQGRWHQILGPSPRQARMVASVERVDSVPVRCITVDSPSQLYLAGEGMVPTHNTNVALTFTSYAQQRGGLCGYEDAEHRFQPTMAKLLPGLNLDDLWFSEPHGGEAALNQARDYIQTGLFDIWTIDSVHGCVPATLMSNPIGKATMAELAKLMSVGCQVLDAIVAETNTVLIFVNHIKDKPGVLYGKDWSKPGGSALDYYASVQLNVRPIAIYQDAERRKIGQTVRVRVENSKVAAPYAQATYDLYLAHGKIKKKDDERDGMVVSPGIDLGSCWFSVCEETGLIAASGAQWHNSETGEVYGKKRDVMEMLQADCELRQQAESLVYSEYASDSKAGAVA